MSFLGGSNSQKQSQRTQQRPVMKDPISSAVNPRPVQPPVEEDTLSTGWPQIFDATPVPSADSAVKAAEKLDEETPNDKALLFSAGNDMKGELNSSTDIIIEGNFIGPIHTAGNVFIRNGGKVNGDITAKRVKVSNGQLIGNTDAETVIVDGRMRGNIDAKSAAFRSGARYKGDVITDELSIADGASVRGSITVHGDGDDDEETSEPENGKTESRQEEHHVDEKKASAPDANKVPNKGNENNTRPGASMPKVVN